MVLKVWFLDQQQHLSISYTCKFSGPTQAYWISSSESWAHQSLDKLSMDFWSLLKFEIIYLWLQRRQWQPTPAVLPGKSHGHRSLVGCSPWGWQRVRHNWVTLLSLFLHWRRKWQPTPVFFPGESQGWQNLVSCHLRGRTESDTTEATWQ